MTSPGSIPFYDSEEFRERLAFALWSYARFNGDVPLTELGSWAQTKDRWLEMASYVVADLDRAAA